MDWKWIRRGLVLAGGLYLWALIPVGIKPSFVNSPIKKSDQTITVDIDSRSGPLSATNVDHIRTACKAPYALRPVMRSADHARVIEKLGTEVVSVHIVDCAKYVSPTP